MGRRGVVGGVRGSGFVRGGKTGKQGGTLRGSFPVVG